LSELGRKRRKPFEKSLSELIAKGIIEMWDRQEMWRFEPWGERQQNFNRILIEFFVCDLQTSLKEVEEQLSKGE